MRTHSKTTYHPETKAALFGQRFKVLITHKYRKENLILIEYFVQKSSAHNILLFSKQNSSAIPLLGDQVPFKAFAFAFALAESF